ncbi:phosphate ABC transporter permease subunit PstC [Inquilinus sp. CAU 1745]|uniref:phosphate ABC transporter permease subunit PstC n=1 Tax=Inquilinus sp. CAU 1745 TaxID=3140369 RepID=UPI00325BE0BF
MSMSTLMMVLLALSIAGFFLGRRRAFATAGDSVRSLHSVPNYHGAFVALWCGVPALLLLLVWQFGESALVRQLVLSGVPAEAKQAFPVDFLWLKIANAAAGATAGANDAVLEAAQRLNSLQTLSDAAQLVLVLVLAAIGLWFARRRITPALRARNAVETAVTGFMILCSTIAIFTTLGIVLSLLFESLRFFDRVPVTEFLFGLQWSPQTAIRPDQVGSSGAFGAVPVFAGTALISLIAMVIAVPLGLLSAIFMSDYAPRKLRSVAKPMLEILAGVPTVVYGYFAVLTVAPLFRDIGESVGLDVAANSALTAGLIMGVMIIPFVSSLSDDVINAVPQSLRDGSAALGATKSETIRQVVLPAALPGIVGAVLLAVSRAIGETMIVVMAAGLAANLTANPFEAVTTVTVQIVTNLTGDQAFDSAKTLSAFALGLLLFIITLILNVVALRVVQKYREKYD